MSTADPRGFVYELEAARVRARHQVDIEVTALTACLKRLTEAQAGHDSAVGELQRVLAFLAPSLSGVIDPHRLMDGAAYLAHLRLRLTEAARQLAAEEQAVDGARAELMRARARLKSFDEDQAAAVASYQQGAALRSQNAADHEWLALRDWQGKQVRHVTADRPEGW